MKKTLALILTLCMLVSLVPAMPVFAAGEGTETYANEVPSSFGPNSDYYEYLFGQSYVPGGQAGGAIDRQTSRVTSYELVDLTKTAPWKFANAYGLDAYHMDTATTVLNQIQGSKVGSAANLTVAIYIPKAGEYTFDLMAHGYPSGGTCDVYFTKCPDDFTIGSIKYAVPSDDGVFKASDKLADDVSFWRASSGKLPYETLGVINAESAGTYLVCFTGHAKHPENTGADSAMLNHCLAGIKLTPVVENVVESIEIKAEETELAVGESTTVSVAATWSAAGVQSVNIADVALAVSPAGVVTVSDAGAVTAVAEGTATITATYEGKTSSVEITVLEEAAEEETYANEVPSSFGPNSDYYEYLFGQSYVPGGEAGGTINRQTNKVTSYELVDLTKTAPWKFANAYGLAAYHMDTATTVLNQIYEKDLGSAANLTVAIYIPEAGEYTFDLMGHGYPTGGACDVYFAKCPDDFTAGSINYTIPSDSGVFKASDKLADDVSFWGASSGKLPYKTLGVIEVESAGTYLVSFTGHSKPAENTNAATNSSVLNNCLAGIKLTPVVENVIESIEIKAAEKSLYVGSDTTISLTATWSAAGKQSVNLSDANISVSPASGVVTVSDAGVVTAIGAGTATITATYEGKTSSVEIAVSEIPSQRDHEYILSQAGLNVEKMQKTDDGYGNKPVLRARNSAIYYMTMLNWTYEVPAEYSNTDPQEAFMALDTTTADGDAKLTDKWAFAASKITLSSPLLDGTRLAQQFTPTSYTSNAPNFVAVKIYVDAPGEYSLFGKTGAKTNGAAPAVYFFKEGAEGVTLGSASTYPAGSKLGYFNMSTASDYTAIGTVNIDAPGTYIVSFVADETSLTKNSEVLVDNGNEYQWFELSALKLAVPKVDELDSITLTADKTTLYADGATATLSVTEKWTESGERDVENSAVTFTASPAGIVEISASGVVTGVAEGEAEVTATYGGKSATVKIKVLAEVPAPHTFEYITSQAGLNVEKMQKLEDYAGKPVLRAATSCIYFMQMLNWKYEVPAEYSNTDPQEAFMALDTTEDDGDAKLTDKWAFVSSKISLGSPLLESGRLAQQFTTETYSSNSPNYVALRIDVDAPGEYIVQAKTSAQPIGAVPAVYLFKEGTAGVTTSSVSSYPADSKLGYLNMATSRAYTTIGTYTFNEPGSYIISFVATPESLEKNSETTNQSDKDYQWFDLSGIRLLPAADDALSGLELTASRTSIPIGFTAELTVKKIFTTSGTQIADLSTIEFASSNEAVATVDENGVVTPVAASDEPVTITATVKGTDPAISAAIELMILPELVPTTNEFIIGLDAFNKGKMVEGASYTTTPTLRPGMGLMYYRPAMHWEYEIPAEFSSTGVAFKAMNLDLTAPWAIEDVKIAVGSPILRDASIDFEFSPSTYGTNAPSMISFRLKVEAPGEYILRATSNAKADAPVPAVYFFRDGTEGVINDKVSTYPESSKLSYYNIPASGGSEKTLGLVNIEEAGEYILAFVGDDTSWDMNKTIASNSTQNISLKSIRIIPSSEDTFTGKFELSAAKQLVMVGRTIQLDVSKIYKISGEVPVKDFSEFEFESEDEEVATVDENGVVTGVAESETPVKIIATLKGSSPAVKKEILIKVAPMSNQGTYEYRTVSSAFNYEKLAKATGICPEVTDDYYLRDLTLEQGSAPSPGAAMIMNERLADPELVIPANYYGEGNPAEPFYAMDTTDRDGDPKETDPWKYVGGKAIDSATTTVLQIRGDEGSDGFHPYYDLAQYTDGADTHFTAFRITVPEKGEYMLTLNAKHHGGSPAPAVYFFKNTQDWYDDASFIETADKLGYFKANDTSKQGYEYIATVNVPEAGDYVVGLVMDTTSKGISPNGLGLHNHAGSQYIALYGIKLVPLYEDVCTGISIDAYTDIMYANETLELTVNEVWDVVGEKEVLDLSTIIFESSDETIATVDENGVVTGVTPGEVVITATKKNTYPEVKTTFKVTLYDPNEEILGLRLNYVTATIAMADQTTYNPHNNRLDSSGNLRDLSYVDEYKEISEAQSAPWAYVSVGNCSWVCLQKMYMSLATKPTDYARNPYFAIKIRVPVRSDYYLNAQIESLGYGSDADVHILPTIGVNSVGPALATPENYVGTIDGTGAADQRISRITIEKPGDYYVIFKLHSENQNFDSEGRNMFQLKGISLVSPAGPYTKVGMYIGGEDAENIEVPYNIAREFTFKVCDAAGVEQENVNYATDVTVNRLEITKGADVAKLEKKDGKYILSTGEKAGEVNITANVTYNGETVETVLSFYVADIAKSGRTIYTDEMIENARENIRKYSWARSAANNSITKADQYVALGAEYLWNMISGNGLPRAYNVALEISHPIRDPYEFYCRYCGTDLLGAGYGNYPWVVDGVKDPWKIKCPVCSRRFPSNDFGKFYELGRTQENGGLFDRDTALENHRAMLIERGLLSEEAINMDGPGSEYTDTWYKYYGYGVKGGYLYNDLYPEVGNADSKVKFATADGLRNGDAAAYKTIVPETVERWGVDDGHGYVTGRVYTNDVKEFHTYIAYFNHFGVYYDNGKALASTALNELGMAYLYTGDIKYGRLGAIILDRMADVYPDMSIKYWSSAYGRRYPNSTGGSPAGKDLGRIWGTFTAKIYAEAYDRLYPAFEDPEVIEFLSEKAEYYGMENNKASATRIRQNIEDGILREIFEACKTSQLNGNFGLHHAALISAAVALDDKEDTSEMIEWLYSASTSDGHSYNTGGDVNRKLLATVYRDGMVNESPYYNEMAFSQLIGPAETLEKYVENGGDLTCTSFFEHPKYLKSFTSFMPLVVARRGVPALADAGNPFAFLEYPGYGSLVTAFNATKNRDNPEIREENIKIAQLLYLYEGDSLKKVHYNVWTKNPETVYEEITAVIKEHGEYNWDKSTIMTGYGYGVLRAGTLHDTVGVTGVRDTQRDFLLNFSGHNLHNHHDLLDIQMNSYGIPLTFDFGYAEFMVTGDPHSNQLTAATIGHNTVVVDETDGVGSKNVNDVGVPQTPLHFDATDTRVKVMDARTPIAYKQCDDYRRTIVMIDYDDEVSYGVDFFRVDGGSDHLWTFQPAANTRPEHSDNLSFIKQVDEPLDTWREDRNYYPFSSYAGPSVQFGEDPGGYGNLTYPKGYTWMYDVERADNPGTGEFWLDYSIKDFKNYSRNPGLKLRLRITQLNDFDVDEVSLTSMIPQRIKANDDIDHLEKILIRRKGKDLDSLFTTVYEPYKEGNRYVTNIEQISATRSGGADEGENDVVKAVKVTIGEDRIDYVVYATNRDVIYTVTDGNYSFEFAGFVGVWTINGDGECTYKYLNDGTILGEGEKKFDVPEAAATGTVVDFQKEFSLDNWIDIEFDRDMSDLEVENLRDRMIIPERDEDGTSAYLIEDITRTGDNTARINLNSTSTVDGFVDMFDESKGYVYILEEERKFEIPLSFEDAGNPVFDEVADQAVSVGSVINVTVSAKPVTDDLTVTYRARNLPRGAGFDASTATFSWKPTATQIGMNLVAIDAIDSAGRISTLYFEIEVFGSTSGGGGGGGGMDIPSKDEPKEEPKEEPDEPTVEPDEPTVDEPTVDVPTEKGFTDLGNHAWAEDAINYLADEGIIKGTSDVTFAPQNNITRADYAILLVRAFKLESEATENFADVSASDYFARELAVARNTGIVGGVGNNNYAPKNTITRQDMMVILYRALTKMGVELKSVEGKDVTSYADFADVADYAKEAVKALVEVGLVNGKGENLAGSDKTTRAEVAVLLKRILDYIA